MQAYIYKGTLSGLIAKIGADMGDVFSRPPADRTDAQEIVNAARADRSAQHEPDGDCAALVEGEESELEATNE